MKKASCRSVNSAYSIFFFKVRYLYMFECLNENLEKDTGKHP